MFTSSESNDVCKEYGILVKTRSKKTTKIWISIFLVYLGIMIILPLIPGFFESDPGWLLYIIYGGIAFVGLVIAISISIFSISDKPAFNYLYEKIYNKINQDNGEYYEYIPFEKGPFTFNKDGGLFSRHCRYVVRRHVFGTSPNSNKFDIYDVTLITGNGKNQHTWFSGIYFKAIFRSSNKFQIRSHSKPKLKDVKFNKVEDITEYRVYLEEEKSITNREYKYIEVLKRLETKLNSKKIYLSVTNDEIHFAYVPKVQIRKQYDVTVSKMNELYTKFLEEINLIDELVEADSF